MTRANRPKTYKELATEVRDLAAAAINDTAEQELIRLADRYDRLDRLTNKKSV